MSNHLARARSAVGHGKRCQDFRRKPVQHIATLAGVLRISKTFTEAPWRRASRMELPLKRLMVIYHVHHVRSYKTYTRQAVILFTRPDETGRRRRVARARPAYARPMTRTRCNRIARRVSGDAGGGSRATPTLDSYTPRHEYLKLRFLNAETSNRGTVYPTPTQAGLGDKAAAIANRCDDLRVYFLNVNDVE
ncbi:hypothetical protein EVAR_2453_1 [Eumeta japonica]|uniref:Uncharacterized protein n=1 Tax=Eumeta variegata TaxID=151549 RepID=A0A4C1SND0_EUMVA|nr:hypothetical protein EVAR_2453_1 [Eumeta japonica]